VDNEWLWSLSFKELAKVAGSREPGSNDLSAIEQVIQARVALASAEAAEAARGTAKATRWLALATVALAVATVALAVAAFVR
jgi:hypothetical protein